VTGRNLRYENACEPGTGRTCAEEDLLRVDGAIEHLKSLLGMWYWSLYSLLTRIDLKSTVVSLVKVL
jgi:hypothetical protein